MRKLTREPLVRALKELLGEDWAWLDREPETQPYETWRAKILERPPFHGRLDELWAQVIEHSFAGYERQLSVGAVVPCYGITPEEIRDTLQSLKNQTYPFSEVVVVLNEPGNQAAREAIFEWVTLENMKDGYERWHFIDRDRPGKRGAMAAGFRALKQLGVDIIVNVDADTVADADALANTVRVFQEDQDCHLITSNVRIKNLDHSKLWGNMLPQWTFYRYDYANLLERGAQSWFKNVTCGSGPWLAFYANDLTEELIEKFLSHTFFGAPVRPGDDRYLTRLLNALGLGTMFTPEVVVWTDCPTEWPRFRQQQSRWAQSAQINFLQIISPWLMPWAEVWKLRLWSISDLFYLGLFTYLVMGVFIRLGVRFMSTWTTTGIGPALAEIAPYALAFFLSNLWKGVYAAVTNKNWRGMFNALYFLVVIFVITPVKIRRNFNLTDTGWGGRSQKK
jgi:cellulose synthase/poly-beta-1,6-N-acetylglucosamine synthase-like glycosyltransferase